MPRAEEAVNGFRYRPKSALAYSKWCRVLRAGRSAQRETLARTSGFPTDRFAPLRMLAEQTALDYY